MKVINWDEFLKSGLSTNGKPVAMTVGVFDGVHKGHKALIERVTAQSELMPVIVTFREPVHKNERAPFIIQSFEERAAALEALGIEALIVIDFTDEFSRITGIEFLQTLLARAAIGFFAVGMNFRCGCGLSTDAEAIRSFFAARNIRAEIVPEVLHNGEPISSSRIREALIEGDIDLAEAMLG